MTNQLTDELTDIVGVTHVLRNDDDMAPFLTDWRGRYTGRALCVARPGNTVEVSRVVSACAAAGVAIVPQGGNTGLVGGATPCSPAGHPKGEVLVSLTRLNRIRNIDPDNNTMTVETGCILQRAQEAAATAGRLFPLSLAAEGTATIGGNLSTTAGGVQVLR
jgi:FAD/FMN-containing dehydrogenase